VPLLEVVDPEASALFAKMTPRSGRIDGVEISTFDGRVRHLRLRKLI
jgi:hypothetical protein